MFEVAAIYGAVTAVTTTVATVASALGIKPQEVRGGVFGNQANLLLVSAFRKASDSVQCLRNNWKRLDSRENHILYRAMLIAHWQAIQHAATRHAQHRGIDLKSRLALPEGLRNPFAPARNTSLGLFSQNDEDALRALVIACDDRISKLQEGLLIDVPETWGNVIDQIYQDLTKLVAQNRYPGQGAAHRAWESLEQDFPAAAMCHGFREYFLQFWYDFLSVNFQFLTANDPQSSALLTGKLFSELNDGEGAKALEPQMILKAWEDSAQAILKAVEDSEHAVLAGLAKVAATVDRVEAGFAELRIALQDPRLAPVKEPLIGLGNTYKHILARDNEAGLLLEALSKPGPGIVSIASPPGFGKSAVFLLAASRMLPLSEDGLTGIAVLDARNKEPGIATFANLVGRMTGLQEAAARFSPVVSAHDGDEHQKVEIRMLFFDLLRRAGRIWLVLENAEGVLEKGMKEMPAELRALLAGWCDAAHQVKLLILTRTALHPLPWCHCRLPELEKALRNGLPEDQAIQVLRQRLEDTRFQHAEEPLLREIAKRLHCVPMALEQFAGYLRTNEAGVQLDQQFIEQNDLLRLFHPDQVEEFLLRLITKHLHLLDESSLRLLRVTAWAGEAVPQSGLLAMDKEFESSDGAAGLTKLVRSGLLVLIEGTLAEGISFSMHPVVREACAEEREPALDLGRVARALLSGGIADREKNQFHSALALSALSERAARSLVGECRHKVEHALAEAVMQRANALNDLGRLPEAVEAYDEAIALDRRLMEQEGRSRLADGSTGVDFETVARLDQSFRRVEFARELAILFINKGAALCRLRRMREALKDFDEAIELCRRPMDIAEFHEDLQNASNPLDGGQLASLLSDAMVRRCMALGDQGRLSECLEACDEAITQCRTTGAQGHPASDSLLAGAIISRGIAFARLGRFPEAVEACDEGIALFRLLVKQEGLPKWDRLLACAIMCRGGAFRNWGRGMEAAAAFDEAVGRYLQLRAIEGPSEWDANLAEACYLLALARKDLGDLAAALRAAEEAHRLFADMVGRGMSHLWSNLADAEKLESRLRLGRVEPPD